MNPRALPANVVKAMTASDRKALGVHTPQESQAIRDGKSHKQVVTEIVNWLALQGVVTCVPRQDKKSGIQEGWTDITFCILVEHSPGCWHGQAMGFEVKVGRDKLSPAQIEMHRLMRSNGWHIAVVGSLDDVIAEVKKA